MAFIITRGTPLGHTVAYDYPNAAWVAINAASVFVNEEDALAVSALIDHTARVCLVGGGWRSTKDWIFDLNPL